MKRDIKWLEDTFGFHHSVNQKTKEIILEIWNEYVEDNCNWIINNYNCKYLVVKDDIYELQKKMIKQKNNSNYKSGIFHYGQRNFTTLTETEYNKQFHKNRQEIIRKNDYGVYAIINNRDEIIYIGKTSRSFEIRFKEHKDIFEGKMEAPQNMKLYTTNENIRFKVLFSVLGSEQELSNRDIECIEMGFIQLFKPKYNYIGNKVPYKFS